MTLRSSSPEHGFVNPHGVWQLVLDDCAKENVPQDTSNSLQPIETLFVHLTSCAVDKPRAVVIPFADELAERCELGWPHESASAIHHPVEDVALFVFQEKKSLKRDPGVDKPIFERPPASGGHRPTHGHRLQYVRGTNVYLPIDSLEPLYPLCIEHDRGEEEERRHKPLALLHLVHARLARLCP